MKTSDILNFFNEILTIPRESGNEQHIIKYLQDFAKANNLECKTDKVGNVVIIKEADKEIGRASCRERVYGLV